MNLPVRPVKLLESLCLSLYGYILICAVSGGRSVHTERKPYNSGSSLSWMVGEGSYICPVSGTFILPGGEGEEIQGSPVIPRQVLAL